ncbi:tetratricopeptide repeat protein [Amycolatopsis sp. NPDC004625]|uniref:ATP-binding protein n=1 Tax=Amycolatopsis sp. NPDC004625 TaxID=3154670 RepID=UPI0033A16A91
MVERNIVSGDIHGSVVQAHTIQGNLHVHAPVVIVPRQLPRSGGEVVGRAAELAALERGLNPAHRTVVISGTAGVGKTALCLHWAWSVAGRFPDGQLYVDLRGFDPLRPPLSTAEVVRGFLDGFGVPAERIPFDVDAQVNLYRSVVADRRVLVVLDNARDANQVRSLLPGGPGCAAVVTSRNELTGLVVRDDVRRIGLDLLGEADARCLIAGRLQGIPAGDGEVGELAARCAGLPLALAIVAGRAAQWPFPLSTLVDELRSATQRLDSLDTGDPYSTARSVFSWSYEALPAPAQRAFRLLGTTTGSDVGLPAAASLIGLPRPRSRALLTELVRANLLEEHLPGRFRFHDLLHEYAVERLAEEPEAGRTAAITRMVESYLQTAVAADALLSPHRLRTAVPPAGPDVVVAEVSDYRQALAWCAAEHQLAVGAVAKAVETGLDRQAWQLAWALVTYLRRFSHHHDRLATQRQALTAARRLGDPHAEGKISRVLGKTLIRLGHQDEADDLLERAVELFREQGDQPEESDALLGRTRLHLQRGRLREADADARRALSLTEAAGHLNLRATALNTVGYCALAAGAPLETITHCTEALQLYREIGNIEGAADVLRMLGSAHAGLGQWDEAIARYEDSLAQDLVLQDEYHAALVLDRIGCAHSAAGRTSDAISAWRRSLALMEYLDPQEAGEIRGRLDAAEGR